MVNIHRHNPVLKERLLKAIYSENPNLLKSVLDSLTATEKRTAGYLLSEQILPYLSSSLFWRSFIHVVPSNSKAYLGTYLKAVVMLLKTNKITLDFECLYHFRKSASKIDIKKMSEAILPYFRKPEDLEKYILLFYKDNIEIAIVFLINTRTSVAYFVLFKILKLMDFTPDVLRSYTISLMKLEKKIAFNMASILKQYYDLQNVPGHLSLHLEPYELSRLDQSYDSFVKIISS